MAESDMTIKGISIYDSMSKDGVKGSEETTETEETHRRHGRHHGKEENGFRQFSTSEDDMAEFNEFDGDFDGPPSPPDGEGPMGPPPDGEGPMGPPPDGEFDGEKPEGPPPDGEFDGEGPMGPKPDKKPDSKPGGDKTPLEFMNK